MNIDINVTGFISEIKNFERKNSNKLIKFLLFFDNQFIFLLIFFSLILFIGFYIYFKSSIFTIFFFYFSILFVFLFLLQILKSFTQNFYFIKVIKFLTINNQFIFNYSSKELLFYIRKYINEYEGYQKNEKKQILKIIFKKYNNIVRKDYGYMLKRYFILTITFILLISPIFTGLSYFLFYVNDTNECVVKYVQEMKQEEIYYGFSYQSNLGKLEFHVDKNYLEYGFDKIGYSYKCNFETNNFLRDYYNSSYCNIISILLNLGFEPLSKNQKYNEFINKNIGEGINSYLTQIKNKFN